MVGGATNHEPRATSYEPRRVDAYGLSLRSVFRGHFLEPNVCRGRSHHFELIPTLLSSLLIGRAFSFSGDEGMSLAMTRTPSVGPTSLL